MLNGKQSADLGLGYPGKSHGEGARLGLACGWAHGCAGHGCVVVPVKVGYILVVIVGRPTCA